MSKKSQRNAYKANKKIKGIIYESVVGDYEITLEKFLDSNPNCTEKDFIFWKEALQELDQKEELHTRAITRKNISLNELEETSLVSVPSAEFDFLQKENEIYLKKDDVYNLEFVLQIAEQTLNKQQYFRFINHFIYGKSGKCIALHEGVNQSSVSRSLSLSRNKVINAINEICIAHHITGKF